MPDRTSRETITRSAEAEFAHKKIFGGGGEFAVVRIRIAPLPRGSGIQFADEMTSYRLPKEWLLGVEEGVREAARRGVLQGGPVVDFKATLLDAKYHEVDSNARTFNLAGQGALRNALHKAGPIILLT